MHPANLAYWKHCAKNYPAYFRDPARVIEFGSYDINGSIRQVFSCENYIGLDWRSGPGVDVVSLAHAYRNPEPFDTVVSASMLEHDPYWPLSIKNMINHMKKTGILVMTWGAGLNEPHCLAEAPDGKFHALKAELVCEFLKLEGLYVHEFRYESYFAPQLSDSRGEVGVVAFKDEKYASGVQQINSFVSEDRL